MTVVWLVPMVPLVVASSSGGLLAEALQSHSVTLALITIGFSFTMLLIGLSFAFMTLTVYFLRLIIYGAPETTLILTAFITLGRFSAWNADNPLIVIMKVLSVREDTRCSLMEGFCHR
jgi:tellurite resistance protein TehA-like permease